MVQELETAIEYFDEPHADSSDFPQYLLSKFTATKVKVALSGDGADELFLVTDGIRDIKIFLIVHISKKKFL